MLMPVPAREVRPDDDRPAEWWMSLDGQSGLDVRGLPAGDARALLLSQCADDEQRERILSGTITINDDKG